MASARSETAIKVSVFGTDASGRPFFEDARVVSIDGFEVAVEGIDRRLDVNDVIGLRHAGQRGRYRVVWLGHIGSPREGQVGLRAVDTDRDIFARTAVRKAAGEHERRRYPRIRCRGDVTFRREGTDVAVAGELKILSEGGCYIETPTPSPRLAHLDLDMSVEELALHSVGEVQALDPGFGMGIAFVEMNPAQRARLHEWVARHSRQ